MINLNLSEYNLLQDIPSSFTIDTVTDVATVSVLINDVTIYTTSLYEYNGVVTFYDLRDIVEQYMRDNAMPLAALKVTSKVRSIPVTSGPYYILFCEHFNSEDIAANFYNYNFLSNRSYYVIPRTGFQTISLFTEGYDAINVFAECIFLKDGERYSLIVPMRTIAAGHPNIYNIMSHPSHISLLAKRQSGEDCGKLLSYTIHAEKRSMTYYVTDELPEIIFHFRNAYNVSEYLYVFGTTNYKTVVDRQEAVCQRRHSFYNQSVQRTHEVTTVPLSMEEAHWYNELFFSPNVTVEMSADYDEVPVLISEITSEISNRPDEKVRMKFSWRFDDNARWINTFKDWNVFNNVYIDTFK